MNIRARLLAAVLTSLLACSRNPGPAEVETQPFILRGAVLDNETGKPVARSFLRLTRRRETERTREPTVVEGLADSSGRFLLAVHGRGRFYLRALRIGYVAVTVRVDMPRDSARPLLIWLVPVPIEVNWSDTDGRAPARLPNQRLQWRDTAA